MRDYKLILETIPKNPGDEPFGMHPEVQAENYYEARRIAREKYDEFRLIDAIDMHDPFGGDEWAEEEGVAA